MMLAADPPAIVDQAAAPSQQDVIEITGTRRDQALKIDRRTYRVNDKPHSAQKDAIQLLRGLPAVTISPDDAINLLGSPNVTIFFDGRKYLGDAKQYLRTLHGSDIERIEVITNPSAQYSAEGTGGIINFVLRRKQGEGASGTAIAEGSSLGGGYVDATVKSKHGKWTYELHTGGRIGTRARSTYRKLRSIEEAPGGSPTINTEDGRGPSDGVEGEGSAKVTYELDAKTSLSAKILAATAHDTNTVSADFIGLTPGFPSFSEHQRLGTTLSFVMGELSFEHKGAKEGETLTASLRAFGNPDHETNAASFSNGAALSTDKQKRFLTASGQVDWQHPMGKGEILSVGGTWDHTEMRERYRFVSTDTAGSLGNDVADQFRGVDDKLAGYATFQQPIGGWTVMPGLRFERDSRHVSSPGEPDVDVARTDFFPTLHVERPLSKALDLTLSYSKRIDRPQLNDLRPYPLVQDVLTIKLGNPRLEDQSTDAYEINLHYRRKKLDAGLIVYDRVTSRLWSQSYSTIAAVNVFTIINTGQRRDLGAELDINTPIAPRLKANASVNLFDERVPTGVADGRDEAFRYTANTTLEWDGRDRGKVPGDVAQLQWIYNSPTRQFQLSEFSWNWLSASYSHSFSRTVTLTATMTYLTRNGHRLIAPLVQELYTQHSPAEFKIKLLKTFGRPN